MNARRFALLLAAAPLAALPAAATQKTPAQLSTQVQSNFPDNKIGAITPKILRDTTQDIVDSFAPLSSLVVTCSTSQWVNAINASGATLCAQPSFSNLSGSISPTQIPYPSLTSIGGVQAIAAVSQRFMTSINTSGVPILAQPAFSDISGSLAGSQLPAFAGGDCTTSAGSIVINCYFTQSGSGAVTRSLSSKLSDTVSVTDFGAVGDGNISNAATNTAAFTSAIATGKCVSVPYTSSGYHFGTGSVTVTTSACILGENKVKIKYTGSTSPFKITAYTLTGAPAVIENFTIDMAGASAGSSAIRNMTSLGVVGAVKIRKIVCLNAYSCIDDDNSGASPPNYVTDKEWDDIEAFLTKGTQFTSNHSRGFMYFRNIRIDETVSGQTAPITWSGAVFKDFIGLEFGRYDRVGNGGSLVYQSTNKCIEIEGLQTPGSLNIPGYASVWVLDRLLCDGTPGDGPSFKNVAYLQATAIESFNALGNAVLFYNVLDSNVSNMLIVGSVGVPGAAAGANGFACTSCTRLNIANLVSNNNTGSGAVITNTVYLTIANYIANANTSWAAVLFGVTGNTQILSGAWSSNGGTLTDSSSGGNNRVMNVIGYNPVGVSSITPGASPYTYTAGTSPETVYVYGGTVSDITQGGVTLATSPAQFQLGPNESIVVTYTVAPTMRKSIP